MKNIFHIFKTDLSNIIKNRAAIIVIIAVMFLPSMYAWFNIIPSWDPYGNTQGVAVAVANLDEGTTIEGEAINVGDEIIDSLVENDKLGWQFVDEQQAIKGVEHGDYYASIIIPKDFSEKLTSVLTTDVDKPVLDYYINEKINAIAPKVTGAGASGIVESIGSGFVKVANEAIFTVFDELGIELEQNRPSIEKVRDSILRLEKDLPEIERMLGVAETDLGLVEVAIGKANEGMVRASEIGKQAEEFSKELDRKLSEGDQIIRKYVPVLQEDLKIAQNVVQQIPAITDKIMSKEAGLDQLLDKAERLADGMADGSAALQKLSDLLKESDQQLQEESKLTDIIQSLDREYERMEQLKDSIKKGIATLEKGDHVGVDIIDKAQELSKRLDQQLEIYETVIIPTIKESIAKVRQEVTKAKESIVQLQGANQSAIDIVHKLQDVGASIDSDKAKQDLGNVLSKVDANLSRIDSLIGLFTRVNTMTGKDLFASQIDTLTKIQSRLETASKLLNLSLQAIERGENPEQSTLLKIEQLLTESNRLLQSMIGSTTSGDAFERTIIEMKKVEESLQLEVDKLRELTRSVSELADTLLNVVQNPEKTVQVLQSMINKFEAGQGAIQSVGKSLERVKALVDAGVLADGAQRIENVQDGLVELHTALQQAVDKVRTGKGNIKEMNARINEMARKMDESIGELSAYIETDLIPKYEEASKKASQALGDANRVMAKANTYFPQVNILLEKAGDGVGMGKEGLMQAKLYFPEVKQKVIDLAKSIRDLEEKGNLDQLIELMKNNPSLVSEFFAEPLLLNEHELFPIPNYGSAMSPFFTTMSLWVGALILVSSLIVDVENKHAYRSYEAYFGRFLTFWMIGLVQSFIVTMGDMFLLKTFVAHKLLFVLFGFLISTTFVMIVYTLVSVFGNTGKVFGIILLVMQLGASGGTFPIQMAPVFFQKIHAFLPFTHALNLLREAAGGVIWGIVWKHVICLVIYMGISLIIGIRLKERINKSSDKFLEDARESKVII